MTRKQTHMTTTALGLAACGLALSPHAAQAQVFTSIGSGTISNNGDTYTDAPTTGGQDGLVDSVIINEAGTYQFLLGGGTGGDNGHGNSGGNGLSVLGDITLDAGTDLDVIAGQVGETGGSGFGGGGGGGGGSFVFTVVNGQPGMLLFAAGGGGGAGGYNTSATTPISTSSQGASAGGGPDGGAAGTDGGGGGGGTYDDLGIGQNGGGGAGFDGAGLDGEYAYSGGGGQSVAGDFTGGKGNNSNNSDSNGGFGGGGGGGFNGGGGGGGYSGGGGGDGVNVSTGGNGGDYEVAGATNLSFGQNGFGVNGNGLVQITDLTPAASPAPEPSQMALFGFVALGLGGLVWRARRRQA